jgi:hypothetical protein
VTVFHVSLGIRRARWEGDSMANVSRLKTYLVAGDRPCDVENHRASVLQPSDGTMSRVRHKAHAQ